MSGHYQAVRGDDDGRWGEDDSKDTVNSSGQNSSSQSPAVGSNLLRELAMARRSRQQALSPSPSITSTSDNAASSTSLSSSSSLSSALLPERESSPDPHSFPASTYSAPSWTHTPGYDGLPSHAINPPTTSNHQENMLTPSNSFATNQFDPEVLAAARAAGIDLEGELSASSSFAAHASPTPGNDSTPPVGARYTGNDAEENVRAPIPAREEVLLGPSAHSDEYDGENDLHNDMNSNDVLPNNLYVNRTNALQKRARRLLRSWVTFKDEDTRATILMMRANSEAEKIQISNGLRRAKIYYVIGISLYVVFALYCASIGLRYAQKPRTCDVPLSFFLSFFGVVAYFLFTLLVCAQTLFYRARRHVQHKWSLPLLVIFVMFQLLLIFFYIAGLAWLASSKGPNINKVDAGLADPSDSDATDPACNKQLYYVSLFVVLFLPIWLVGRIALSLMPLVCRPIARAMHP